MFNCLIFHLLKISTFSATSLEIQRGSMQNSDPPKSTSRRPNRAERRRRNKNKQDKEGDSTRSKSNGVPESERTGSNVTLGGRRQVGGGGTVPAISHEAPSSDSILPEKQTGETDYMTPLQLQFGQELPSRSQSPSHSESEEEDAPDSDEEERIRDLKRSRSKSRSQSLPPRKEKSKVSDRRRASLSYAEAMARNSRAHEECEQHKRVSSSTKKVSAKNFKNLYLEKFTGDEVSPGFYGYEDWRAQCTQAMKDCLELDDVYFTDPTRRLLLRYFMTGKAATWYTQQYYEEAPTLEELDRDMKSNFGMANNTLYIINVIQRTGKVTSDSYEEFARKLKRLARSGASYAYPVIMETVVRCFAKNACDSMSRHLLSMIPVHGRLENFFMGRIMTEMVQKLTSVSGNTGAGEAGVVLSVAINRFGSAQNTGGGDEANAHFLGQCHYCKKMGHMKKDCKKRLRAEANKKAADDALAAAAVQVARVNEQANFQQEN